MEDKLYFNTCLFDILEGFQPPPLPDHDQYPSPPNCQSRAISLLISIFFPFVTVYWIVKHTSHSHSNGWNIRAIFLCGASFVCWCVFIGLQLSWIRSVAFSYLAWIICFAPFFMMVTLLRIQVRELYGIYGNYAEDIFVAMMMYGAVLSQLE